MGVLVAMPLCSPVPKREAYSSSLSKSLPRVRNASSMCDVSTARRSRFLPLTCSSRVILFARVVCCSISLKTLCSRKHSVAMVVAVVITLARAANSRPAILLHLMGWSPPKPMLKKCLKLLYKHTGEKPIKQVQRTNLMPGTNIPLS